MVPMRPAGEPSHVRPLRRRACFTEELNPDTAVKMMEALAGHLQEMDKGFLRELVVAFQIIAENYSGEEQKVVRSIADGYYLEEALAADGPVKLAELEALRDARD